MSMNAINNAMNTPSINFGARNKKAESKPEMPKSDKTTIDLLRKQLMNMAVASMILVGSTGVTSCTTGDEPKLPDTFILQCPKVELPVRSMYGVDSKASCLFQSIGLLPKGASIMDLDQIDVVNQQTGDKINYKMKEADDDKITMDYTVTKADGTKANSTYEITDNPYGGIKCILKKADGVDYQYKTYTQYSYDFDDLYEWSAGNGNKTSNAIIRNAGDGNIKRINDDNSIEYYNVSSKLK